MGWVDTYIPKGFKGVLISLVVPQAAACHPAGDAAQMSSNNSIQLGGRLLTGPLAEP